MEFQMSALSISLSDAFCWIPQSLHPGDFLAYIPDAIMETAFGFRMMLILTGMPWMFPFSFINK